jgi:hypothetical protein
VKKSPFGRGKTPLPEGKTLSPREKPSTERKSLHQGKIPSKRRKPLHQGKNPSSRRENALRKGKIFARPPQNQKNPRSRIDLGSKVN